MKKIDVKKITQIVILILSMFTGVVYAPQYLTLNTNTPSVNISTAAR